MIEELLITIIYLLLMGFIAQSIIVFALIIVIIIF